jgi:curved DNA-binding protein CbpA
MIASQSTEITFYEELGLAPGASPEEIHDTFRALVRLLHPDQQTDPLLKEIAEKQMRKLNRIYSVLSDPDRRRRYDETLDEDDLPATIIINTSANPNLGRLVGRIAWIAAILVSAGLLVWLASEIVPAPPSRSHDQTTASYDPTAATGQPRDSGQNDKNEIQRLRSSLQALTVERDAAVRELTRLRGSSSTPSSAPTAGSTPVDTGERNPAPVTLTELPSPVKLPPPPSPAPARVEPVVNRHLAGFWFYTKPPRGQVNTNTAFYPPEYIEATITEENGIMRGKYRSRFQIVDRAISPDVNFTFSGTVKGTTVTCPWTGPGGAKGEITLTLTSGNAMRVDWTASELGNQQGLVSGTAILTRRID